MHRVNALGCLAIMACLSVGCASTPRAQYAQARDTVSAAETTLLALHDQGVVSDEELVDADTYIQAARAALKDARARLPEGGDTFERLLGAVDAAMAKIEQLETDQ